MRLYKGFLFFLFAAPKLFAPLSCYSCTNVENLKSCKYTTCENSQACFTHLKKKEQSVSITMGCIQNETCSLTALFNTSNLSKRSNVQVTKDCYECCSEDLCNKQLCVDIIFEGNWEDWSSWSECDVTCGHGKNTRIRTCLTPALECLGNNTEIKSCFQPKCPVHGGWAEWSSWESCPVTCDIGIQKRHRTCTNPSPQNHGDHCLGDTMDVKLCKQNPCYASDGGWPNWNTWSTCSVSCGAGFQARSRSCINPVPGINGKPCFGDPIQVETCNKEECLSVSGSSVAFNAIYVYTYSPARDQTAIFTKLLLNEGGAYNETTGIFVAPKNGIYTFYAQMCVNTASILQFDIMVGANVSSSAYAFRGYGCECLSTQTIAKLNTGDKVYVQWRSRSYATRSRFCPGAYERSFFAGKFSNP